MNGLLPLSVAFALSAINPPDILWAQTEGRITGVVRDASGAAVPGATVTATSQATKDAKTATTANDGSYAISAVPGSYTVFNLPVSDTAAVRVAGYYDRLPGYMDAVQPNLSVRDDVNGGFRTGLRAAVKFTPSAELSITPRLIYQRVDAGGRNRIDDYNILGNPFTTTRSAVTLGEREQFTQLEEDFTDDFVLSDVNINYEYGDLVFTSITSYTYRNLLVIRDATALTASITGGSLGLPPAAYTLNAPLDDATTAKVWDARSTGFGRAKQHALGGRPLLQSYQP
jgi:hypothetical protein